MDAAANVRNRRTVHLELSWPSDGRYGYPADARMHRGYVRLKRVGSVEAVRAGPARHGAQAHSGTGARPDQWRQRGLRSRARKTEPADDCRTYPCATRPGRVAHGVKTPQQTRMGE